MMMRCIIVGLNNVRARLALLYAGKHDLLVHPENNSFSIKLTLQFMMMRCEIVGLSNVPATLALLYAGKHELLVHPENNLFSTKLTLQLL